MSVICRKCDQPATYEIVTHWGSEGPPGWWLELNPDIVYLCDLHADNRPDAVLLPGPSLNPAW